MQERFTDNETKSLEAATRVCGRVFVTGGFSTDQSFKRPFDHVLFMLVGFGHLHSGFATKHSLLDTIDIADCLLDGQFESDTHLEQEQNIWFPS